MLKKVYFMILTFTGFFGLLSALKLSTEDQPKNIASIIILGSLPIGRNVIQCTIFSWCSLREIHGLNKVPFYLSNLMNLCEHWDKFLELKEVNKNRHKGVRKGEMHITHIDIYNDIAV